MSFNINNNNSNVLPFKDFHLNPENSNEKQELHEIFESSEQPELKKQRLDIQSIVRNNFFCDKANRDVINVISQFLSSKDFFNFSSVNQLIHQMLKTQKYLKGFSNKISIEDKIGIAKIYGFQIIDLDLSFYPDLTSKQFNQLTRLCPNIESLSTQSITHLFQLDNRTFSKKHLFDEKNCSDLITNSKKLKAFKLSSFCSISNVVLDLLLKNYPQLTSLSIGLEKTANDETLSLIEKQCGPSLTSLKLTPFFSNEISKEAVQKLIKACPNLVSLYLHSLKCDKKTIDLIADSCPSLHTLYLEDCFSEDSEVDTLKNLGTKCKKLQHFSSHDNYFNSEHFKAFLISKPKLKTFNAFESKVDIDENCELIDDLVENCSELTHIGIRGQNHEFQDGAIDTLISANWNLESINFWGFVLYFEDLKKIGEKFQNLRQLSLVASYDLSISEEEALLLTQLFPKLEKVNLVFNHDSFENSCFLAQYLPNLKKVKLSIKYQIEEYLSNEETEEKLNFLKTTYPQIEWDEQET